MKQNVSILVIAIGVALIFFSLGFAYQVFVVANHSVLSSQRSSLRNGDAVPVGPILEPNSKVVQVDEWNRLLGVEAAFKSASSSQNVPLKCPPSTSDSAIAPAAITYPLVAAGADLTALYGAGGERDVPPIVKAWRSAQLDWHSLLPKHNSVWERFGTPEKEGKLRLLVSKEVQTTDFLTRFHESGLAARYGHEHGPLLAYSGCDAFVSVCMMHDERGCSQDQLCMWSASEQLCVDATAESRNQGSQCANPVMFTNRGKTPVSDPRSQCKVWVDQPAVVMTFDGESQAMFYHWWASWSSVQEHWSSHLKKTRDFHVIINDINDPMFFQYFGIISNNCWRRAKSQVPDGVCFCNTHDFHAGQTRSRSSESASNIIKYLGLDDAQPPADRPSVGIISRRRKRFILNEYELVDAVRAMGYDCELLPLESMTLYEQMRALRSIDVLVGIHGSALDNSVFLHKSSVMLQLLPYKLEHRVTFPESAKSAGMVYMEWQLQDITKTFLHWDLFEQANKEKLASLGKEEILRQGQVAADNRETTMFWINQDIIVPLSEWKPLIQKAVAASPAAKRSGVKL